MKLATLKPKVGLLDSGPQTLTSPSFQDERRGSRHARGYGSAWDRLRLRILKRDGHLCQCRRCHAKGLIRPATHVDHKVSKALWKLQHGGSLAGVDDPSNLQAINAECHKAKTQEDQEAIRQALL